MRQRPEYQQLKQIAIDGDYTLEQVQGVTRTQIESLLGKRIGGLFPGIKELLIMDIIDRDDKATMQQLRSEIISVFPDAEFEKGREEGKRFVTVWIDRKP